MKRLSSEAIRGARAEVLRETATMRAALGMAKAREFDPAEFITSREITAEYMILAIEDGREGEALATIKWSPWCAGIDAGKARKPHEKPQD